MDFEYENDDRMQTPFGQGKFGFFSGKIVDMMWADSSDDYCVFVTVEDSKGDITNFAMSKDTYVVDFETLAIGMDCTFWYPFDAPAPLIFPPRYSAAVAAVNKDGRNIKVDCFDDNFVSAGRDLQIHIEGVEVLTTNNQVYYGCPAGRNLVVFYENTTRSIPAQTTPDRVIVL